LEAALHQQDQQSQNLLDSGNAGYLQMQDILELGTVSVMEMSSATVEVMDSGGVQNANFGIRKDGTRVVGYLSEEMVNPRENRENPFIQLVSGVIWLIRNGSIYVDESKKAECRETEETGSMDLFADVMSARTALGHDKNGRVMIVQIDGKTNHRG